MNTNDRVTFRFKGQLYLATVEVKQAVFAACKAGELAAAAKLPKGTQVDPSFVEARRAAGQPVLDAALAAKTCEPVYHKFEKAGLGLAPFHCIGMEEKTYVACHGAPVQPGGTCDYCGQAIRYVFRIQSRDGKQFNVGSDCVCKTDDAGLKREVKTHPEVLRMAREKRQAKSLATFKALSARMKDETLKATLSARPHPRGFCDRKTGQPLTEWDDVQWLFNNCGDAGRKALLKRLEAVTRPA